MPWRVRSYRSRDARQCRDMEARVFGDAQVPWRHLRSIAGRQRYKAFVIRTEKDHRVVAVAVLDNRRDDPRYSRGWIALDTLMRDPSPDYDQASLGRRLLVHVQRKVSEEPVKTSLYCRVKPNQPRLVQWYQAHGFTVDSDDTTLLTWNE